MGGSLVPPGVDTRINQVCLCSGLSDSPRTQCTEQGVPWCVPGEILPYVDPVQAIPSFPGA